mmetsp:Transcript_70511/g.187827  ORF Transcript_70511/g.187827 Transcript_70511/m.187827 type:complete len:89 (+) Transcript_70511:216-482(+)
MLGHKPSKVKTGVVALHVFMCCTVVLAVAWALLPGSADCDSVPSFADAEAQDEQQMMSTFEKVVVRIVVFLLGCVARSAHGSPVASVM